jgi:hypothetical protein
MPDAVLLGPTRRRRQLAARRSLLTARTRSRLSRHRLRRLAVEASPGSRPPSLRTWRLYSASENSVALGLTRPLMTPICGRSNPLRELLRGSVVQEAVEPVVLATGPRDADLVVAAHRSMHGLPLATPAEGRWRRQAHGLKHGEDRGFDLRGAGVQEVFSRDSPVLLLVVHDPPLHGADDRTLRPGQRRNAQRCGTEFRRPPSGATSEPSWSAARPRRRRRAHRPSPRSFPAQDSWQRMIRS